MTLPLQGCLCFLVGVWKWPLGPLTTQLYRQATDWSAGLLTPATAALPAGSKGSLLIA